MENDFLYAESFTPQQGILDCPCQVLRFEGIDTVADIRLNGVLLSHVENMHRTFEFDVAGILKPGENQLEVKLYSPTRWIREKYAESPADGSSDAMRGFANLRKAHCMFGWDWGPHLPDAGIWRPVSLLGRKALGVEKVVFHQGQSLQLVVPVIGVLHFARRQQVGVDRARHRGGELPLAGHFQRPVFM